MTAVLHRNPLTLAMLLYFWWWNFESQNSIIKKHSNIARIKGFRCKTAVIFGSLTVMKSRRSIKIDDVESLPNVKMLKKTNFQKFHEVQFWQKFECTYWTDIPSGFLSLIHRGGRKAQIWYPMNSLEKNPTPHLNLGFLGWWNPAPHLNLSSTENHVGD